jgi:hypothetical protein
MKVLHLIPLLLQLHNRFEDSCSKTSALCDDKLFF